MKRNQIEDQWDTIKNQKDILVGRIKQYYGVAKEEAEKQIEKFRVAAKGSRLAVVSNAAVPSDETKMKI